MGKTSKESALRNSFSVSRPKLHFTPPTGWINDPNGLVYYNGEYHLFYQHYPCGIKWGPMHWGHAVSKDLVNWEHLPIALYPDELGNIFSGSAVVDTYNTTGFQIGEDKALVAIFTHASADYQVQSIAYSNDRGRTWEKYKGNPVLKEKDFKDFRDPKVFWHEETGKWIMVVAAGYRVRLYSSPDLKKWSYLSQFGCFRSWNPGVWECPDLFKLPVANEPGLSMWVLSVSIGGNSVNGGPGMMYFIGDFNGREFKCHHGEAPKWVDYGKDFYAAITYSGMPAEDGRTIWIGWMNYWPYAGDIPAGEWRGSMSIPRELSLIRHGDGSLVIHQVPVRELKCFRGEMVVDLEDVVYCQEEAAIAKDLDAPYEIETEIELSRSRAGEFGFILYDSVKVGFDLVNRQVYIKRDESGNLCSSANFYKRDTCDLPDTDVLKLHILVDTSSVEVFLNDGAKVMTAQMFPSSSIRDIRFVTCGTETRIRTLRIYSFDSRAI